MTFCMEPFGKAMVIAITCTSSFFLGVNDLHTFISVALHTSAGEGDVANDNLSRLKIVGSGYSPLIYDLQRRPSFENFKTCCMKVWEVLQHTSTLPEKLVSHIRINCTTL